MNLFSRLKHIGSPNKVSHVAIYITYIMLQLLKLSRSLLVLPHCTPPNGKGHLTDLLRS